MPTPDTRSFDEARQRYADQLSRELRDTSSWLSAPHQAASTEWITELTDHLRRWIGTGEGFGFPVVVRLAKNLTQRVQTLARQAPTDATPTSRDLAECLGVIGQMRDQLQRAAAQQAQLPRADAPTPSILLVDHREELAQPLMSELTRLGFATHGCRSIAEARDWLKQRTPHAIVLSRRLPDGDGLAFCRRLAAQRRHHATTLVVLADDDHGPQKADALLRPPMRQWRTSQQQALRAGAHAYYDQPADPLLVAMRLDDLLRRRAQQAAKPRVLIADPDATRTGRLIRALQQHGFDPSTEHDPDRLMETIAIRRPDVVLLRSSANFSLCRLLRQEEQLTATPIILLTPATDDRTSLKGLEAGADDVLAASTSPATLAAAMRMRLSRLRQLTIMADRDGLTGLWNRDYFARHLAVEVERATRYGGQFVLAIADLDDFKRLNDTYGHLTGDRALQQVAYFLKRRFRRTDLVARYGGEEFVILLYQTTLAQARRVLIAACETPPALRLPGGDEMTIPLSFSMGAAEFPTHGWDTDSIFHAADQALYEAKHLGKRRIECAPLAPAEPVSADTA